MIQGIRIVPPKSGREVGTYKKIKRAEPNCKDLSRVWNEVEHEHFM